jgi:ubiquinone biosynthesis protein COQ4
MLKNLQTLIDATKKVIADPTDTKQAFRIAEAFAFRAPQRVAKRYMRTRSGQQRVKSQVHLIETLQNRELLESMPADSLAAHYLRFIDEEGITPDGLVEASEEGRTTDQAPEVEFVGSELRDMHDIWHVVTGYQTDLLGEAALLAFTSAQLRHPGVGFIAAIAMVLSDTPYYRRFIVDGFRQGRQAAWLPGQPWEQLLSKPLVEVREILGVTAIGPYAEVRDVPLTAMATAAA